MEKLCFNSWGLVLLTFGLFLGPIQPVSAAQPILSRPVWGSDPLHAKITVTNCGDTNVQYVLQMSTNLTSWIPVITYSASPTNFSATVSTTNQACFYRVVTIPAQIPISQLAIAVKSNINLNGNNVMIDSFDSSSTNYSTGGQWDVNKRRANGNVGAYLGFVGDITIGWVNIYGHVYTGPGIVTPNFVQIGNQGAVGDLVWQASDYGIEPGYWATNFNVMFPDVVAPTFAGQALPAPTTNGPYAGSIVLSGGNFTVAAVGNANSTFGSASTTALTITAPTVLWIQSGDVSLLAQNLIFTNTGSLVLYLGTTTGSGDSLDLAGNGTINQPGLAANLQIYGLPSMTSITLHHNAGFIAAIYAPEANFIAGSSGNPLDSSGAMVVNSIKMNGHWNFHYDEHLQAK